MASATESSVESLQLLLAERDTTIATIKERTKTFVEKLKSDHGEALVLEQTSRQQLQDKLEAVKPIFIGLKDEKTALSKEVTELKEQLTIVEREHNIKIIEIVKKNESANKLLLQELSTAKDASTKALATKIEADLSLQSLEEMLALAKQEAITFAKKVANEEELFKSKLTAQLQVVEEFKKRETKDKLESADSIKQLEASNAALIATKKELTDVIATKKELSDVLQQRAAELVSLQSKLSKAENQIVLDEKVDQRESVNATVVADLEKTVLGLQESVKVLASQLSQAEGNASKKLQEEIDGKERDTAAYRTMQLEQNAIIEDQRTLALVTATEKKTISEERDTLQKELQLLKTLYSAQSEDTVAKKEAEKKLMIQCNELKENLLESERRLMEAEDSAWKSKAEAAEILYALEQEQGCVKKLNGELDIMRIEISKAASEHTEMITTLQEKLDEQEKVGEQQKQLSSSGAVKEHGISMDQDKESMTPSEIVKEFPKNGSEGSTGIAVISHKVADLPVRCDAKDLQGDVIDSNAMKMRLSEAESEVARLRAELTSAAAAQAMSIADLTSELLSQKDKAASLETVAAESQASLVVLQSGMVTTQEEMKSAREQCKVAASALEAAKVESTELMVAYAGKNGESENALASLTSDSAAQVVRISELEEELTTLREKEARSEETLTVARLNQGRLKELQEMLANAQEEVIVAKEREAAVNPLEEQLVDAIEELERERLERDQALSACLAEAAIKHGKVISDLIAQHSLAMAAQEEEFKIEEKVASAKEMLSKLKEIISDHVSNEEELNKSIAQLTAESAMLSESLAMSVAEAATANAEKRKAVDQLASFESRDNQATEVELSHSETISRLKDELVIANEKEGRVLQLQIEVECAQKDLNSFKQHAEIEVKALTEKLQKSREELDQVKHSSEEQLAQLRSESAAALKEAETSVLVMKAAVEAAEAKYADLKKANYEESMNESKSELALMQQQFDKAQDQIGAAAQELSTLTAKHASEMKEIEIRHATVLTDSTQYHEVAKVEFERGAKEQAAKQDNLNKSLVKVQEELKNSAVHQSTSEKNLKECKEASTEKISKLNGEIQKLESALGSKKSDLDATKANLAATTTAYSALSAQHNQLKIKTDQLTQQLEAEVSQTQERKQKVRAYVDNLNVEKRDMEAVKQGLIDQLFASKSKITQLENQIVSEEMKLKKEEMRFNTAKQMAVVELEQEQQDYATKVEAQEALFALQVQETQRLQGLLDEHARATAEEVQEAYRQMALSGKELESHKAKRLVARNEMIGAAQALEKSQTEGQALRAYIQYKLAPIVFEQIGALEMLLSAVEHFRMQMANKGNVRLHNTANEFLSRRLVQSPPSPNTSPESSVSSTNSNTGLTVRNINGNMKSGEESELKGTFHTTNTRTGMETGVVRANSPGGSVSGSRAVHYNPQSSGGNNSITVLGEAMEQAEILRMELNRVHAGLSLLSHSVDRLGDVVTVNSKCCGGVFQMFSDSVTGTIEGSIRGSIVGRTLVSHNNTTTTSRRPDSVGTMGLSGMISSGLGYTTVNGDDSLNTSNNSGSLSPRKEGNISKKKEGGNKPQTVKNVVFSILGDEEDDDGEELEMI